MMPENLSQLQDRMVKCVERNKMCRGEIQDILTQYNFDIDSHSFNPCGIIQELTKMSDENKNKLWI